MEGLSFHKYEGLGNDFILVEASTEDAVTPASARSLCDRRLGIGADGVLLLLPPRSQGADARMRVINADGSVPEMCGNGLRCAVLHLARSRGQTSAEITFDTDAGPRRSKIDGEMVTVDMGIMKVGEDVTLEVDGRAFTLTLADAGNPHAITTEEAVVESVGPKLATHPRFPRGTNVEFARFAADAVDLVVWERGAGLTMACGTGACATVAAGIARGVLSAGAEVAVRLPGGTLAVTVDASWRASMRGPAHHVFSGTASR